ncbi:hypothetical protein LEP1GSC172_2327 [Leptospira noguchii]|uniref:Uncharacterized protein n=1 Tax=Leptospira noguchii TaxID=28182 RepID=M6VKT2_9LEPT|nr:hypothetical protein LEP1GSC172_2327 [Leptospira noguchii]
MFQKLEYTTSIKKGLEIRRIKKVEFSNIFKKIKLHMCKKYNFLK